MKNVIYYGDDHYEAYCDCPGGKNSGNDSDGGGSNGDINEVLISPEEPTDPNVEIWVDTDEDPSSLPMDDAPEDGKLYARLDKAWSEVKAGGLGKKYENTVIPPELGIPEDKKDLMKGEIFNLTEPLTTGSGDYQMTVPANKAAGMISHAEGWGTTATSMGGHAEGCNTIARGVYGSHAEGKSTIADGDGCHAEGCNTFASVNLSVQCAHAEGFGTIATGSASHAEGENDSIFRVETISNIVDNTFTSDQVHEVSEMIAGLFGDGVYGRYAIVTEVDSTGKNVTVDRNITITEGTCQLSILKPNAVGSYSHTEGNGTRTNNTAEHAEGQFNKSNTNTISSIGIGTSDEDRKNAFEVMNDGKVYVHGIGTFDGTNPSETNSLQAVIANSGGVGKVDATPDAANHGEIFNSYSGYLANTATGNCSHAEGEGTTASGNYSHAEGGVTTASEDYSHAEGWSTEATGQYSHAEGYNTTASGYHSHSQNKQTTANGFAQTSIGYNNTPEPTPSVYTFNAEKLAFVVGGGSFTETKNVFEVYFNGTTKATGTITGATADYAEMFEWIDNNPLGTDRVGRFVNLVGKKIELATKDSQNIIGIISGNPVVLGDAPNSWQGMYINDKWGRPTYTDHEFEVERQKFNKETGKIEKVKEIKKSHARSINQRYDSSLVYTPREERNEWAAVGMLGKLLVLQDGTLNVGDYCYPSQDGIATKSEKGWYVMDVIDKEQALVLYK